MTRPTPCACMRACPFYEQENAFDTVKETITLTELGCYVSKDKETKRQFSLYWADFVNSEEI